MSKRLTLVLGGVRAGKSRYAQQLAQHGQRVLFVATAEPGDQEMAARIQAHRAERPADWTTLEEPVEVVTALAPRLADFDTVLLDCLTLWVSNLLLQNGGERQARPDIGAEGHRLLRLYERGRRILDRRQQRSGTRRHPGERAWHAPTPTSSDASIRSSPRRRTM